MQADSIVSAQGQCLSSPLLLTGAAGQLGQALIASVPEGIELIATGRSESKGMLSLDFAEAVNAQAPRAFAEALCDQGGRLLQLSTDVVFNGEQGRPYRPEQARNPMGMYGISKAQGEEAVGELALELGLVERMAAVTPITTADHPTPATCS